MSWIGKTIQYNKKESAIVLKKDSTHILIQFSSGAKIATNKNLYTEPKE